MGRGSVCCLYQQAHKQAGMLLLRMEAKIIRCAVARQPPLLDLALDLLRATAR
jgi:hypothetical protein